MAETETAAPAVPQPTMPVGSNRVGVLQSAGFSDAEIGAWSAQRRQVLTDAGYSSGDIDHYLTGVKVPPAPAGLANRIAAAEALPFEQKPGETRGFLVPRLWKLGEKRQSEREPEQSDWAVPDIIASPIRGMAKASNVITGKSPLETVVSPDGTLDSDVLAAEMVLSGERAPGVPRPSGPRTVVPDNVKKGEASPDAFPLARIESAPDGTEQQRLIGNMPQAQDFTNAGKVIANDNEVPKETTGKLLTLYNENGIHPAEVVHDAQNDVTVTQSLLSKGDDLPALYRPENAAEGVEGGGQPPAIPPEPPEGAVLAPEPPGPPLGPPVDVDAAKQRVLDTMSIGEPDPKRAMTWARLYTNFIDQYFPIKQAVTAAQKVIGNLPTWANPYELARLFAGYAGKADHMLNHGMYDFDSYQVVGPSLKAILEPHADDLDGLRVFAKSVRALELNARGIETGVDMDAARMVAQDGVKTYGATMAKLIQYQNQLSAYLRDSGVLSAKGHQAMLEANRLYIPFSRLIEDQEPSFRQVGGTLQAQNPIQRIKGSELKTIDPIETIIRNTYTYVAMAEKNSVGTSLVDMLKRASEMPEHEAPLIPYEAEAGEKPAGSELPQLSSRAPEQLPAVIDGGLDHAIREYLGERGLPADDDLVAFIRTAAKESEGDEIRIFRDGKAETYRVDPELARAMKGLDRQGMGILTKMLSPFARGVRAGAVLTPDFWGRHIIRDFMYAFTTFRNGLFNPMDMVRGVMGLAKKDQDFLDWQKSGGSSISFVSMDRRYLQNSIDKLADTGLLERAWNVIGNPEAGLGQKAGAIGTLPFKLAGKYLIDPLRMGTEFAENASHLGAFKKAMRGMEAENATEGIEGTSKPEIQTAGWISRDVAVDAARIGAQTRSWNAISAFANITFQDTDRVVRAFRDDPVGTAIKVAAGITLPSVLLWAHNHDDPRYHEIPQWQRDLFWIYITPNNGPIFRVAKPWGMGLVFGSGPERILDAFVDHDPDAGKRLKETLFQVSIPGVMPNAVAPIIEQFANRSTFTDRTIVPAAAEKQLPEYQYGPYTTELAKAIGSKIAAFPGMRETSITPGNSLRGVATALTSPMEIENYIRGWTGTGGVYVLSAADAALRKIGVLPDPPTPASSLADIPVIKAFVVRYPTASAQSIQDFHDAYARNKVLYDTWTAQAKEGNAEAMLKIQQIGGVLIFVQLDDIQKTLAMNNQVIRDIYKNPTMPPDQKRQIIDQVYYGMIKVGELGTAIQRRVENGLGSPHP